MEGLGRAIFFVAAIIFIIGFIIGYFIFRNRKIGGIWGGIIGGLAALLIIRISIKSGQSGVKPPNTTGSNINVSQPATQKSSINKSIIKNGVYNSSGSSVNIGSNTKQMSCAETCAERGGAGWELEQYPKGSSSYPYYYCSCKFKSV